MTLHNMGKPKDELPKDLEDSLPRCAPTFPGKAYAFFQCAYGADDVKSALEECRSESRAEEDITLTLSQLGDFARPDPLLQQIVTSAFAQGNNYVLEGCSPRRSNFNVAIQLRGILDFSGLEVNIGRIFSKDGDHYVVMG